MLRSILTIVEASLTLGAAAHSQSPQEAGHYLFVWAGDQANKGNDFLAVIDADPASPSSGQSGDRLHLLKLNEATGALAIDGAFRDADGQPGFNFGKREWPHGWAGEGKPHGAVFSR